MVKIYHNPKCSKSRDGLHHLETLQDNISIIKYLDTPISKEEMTEILKMLNYKPIELIRTKEKFWIENYKNKKLSDSEIIDLLITYPKLMERPIVIIKNRAVVARPFDRINEIL